MVIFNEKVGKRAKRTRRAREKSAENERVQHHTPENAKKGSIQPLETQKRAASNPQNRTSKRKEEPQFHFFKKHAGGRCWDWFFCQVFSTSSINRTPVISSKNPRQCYEITLVGRYAAPAARPRRILVGFFAEFPEGAAHRPAEGRPM